MGDRARDAARVPASGTDAGSPRLRFVILLPGLSHNASGGYKVVYSYANHLASRLHDVTIVHALHLRHGATRKRSARAKVLRAWGEAMQLRNRVDYHVRERHARPTWFHLEQPGSRFSTLPT